MAIYKNYRSLTFECKQISHDTYETCSSNTKKVIITKTSSLSMCFKTVFLSREILVQTLMGISFKMKRILLAEIEMERFSPVKRLWGRRYRRQVGRAHLDSR